MPAADRLGRRLRMLEAEAAERCERLGIVGDAGEDEAAGGGAERRRVLEQPRVMRLDLGQVEGQVAGEGLEPRVAAEPGEARKLGALERQALRLLVGDHLQPVLDRAEEEIGRGQVLHRLGRRPSPRRGARSACRACASRASGPPPAEDELLRLDEELDLADAAAAELDVVPRHDDLLVPAHRVDLALHRVDVGDRRVVEIFAPDERGELGEEAPAEVEVAGRRARLDQRRALPVLAERLVIGVGAEWWRAPPASRPGRAGAAGRPAARSRRRCAPEAAARAPS